MMQIEGIDGVLLVPISAILVIIIAIFLIKKTGKMKKKQAEGEIESEEVNVEEKLDNVESDKVQKYEAKIDQLTTSLNLEREKIKAKDAQLVEQEQSYENDLLKVGALKDEVSLLRKKVGVAQKEQDEAKAKFEAEGDKVKKDAETVLADEKGRCKAEVEKLEKRVEEIATSSASEIRKLKDESRAERDGIIARHIEELEVKDLEITTLRKSNEEEKEKLKRELLDERKELIKSYEDKISEIKAKTKDAIQRVVDEKESLLDRLKGENERLDDERDKLREQIRLLEVDRL